VTIPQTELQTKKSPAASDAKRSARLAAVQSLYQRDYAELQNDGLHLDEGQEMTAPYLPLLQAILETAKQRAEDIDHILTGALDPAWPLERLEQVLRAILRAAVAEFLLAGRKATPTALLITDYVDIAHAFFAGREPALVNAVLDKVGKSLRE
jgi:transcription antitermination protein NusB